MALSRRIVAVLSIAALCATAFGEERARRADDLPDLDAPTSDSTEPGPQPQVTVIEKKDAKFEEYRLRGRLYKIKVTPRAGDPYWLIDDRGDGQFIRYDNLDSGLRVPRWVIKRF